MMKITSAKFVMSNTEVAKCPKAPFPEYAFIGRSNVGKSSLINMLTEHHKLAKTSGTPGKTQLINHFIINEQWHLVDLPGYGYAKVSKTRRSKFQQIIEDYFLKRPQLVCAFVLIDSRHEPQKIDLEFMYFLGSNQIPFCILFTKTDKLKPSQLNSNLKHYSKTMTANDWESTPPFFSTSATSNSGKEEVLGYIDGLNKSFKSHS